MSEIIGKITQAPSISGQLGAYKGEKGDKGDKGDNGKDGKDGVDGYTPLRGIDYWTEQDILSMETYCSDYIEQHITDVIGGEY